MAVKKIQIKGADEQPIDIDFYEINNQPAPLIIFAHGFKGFKDWGTHHLVAQFFNSKGINFLKFNFSHNGINNTSSDNFDALELFSRNTFSKELYDLDQVIEFATSNKEIPIPQQITLIGHSRGGGISIIKAATDLRINNLITWASIGSFNSLWKNENEAEWISKGTIFTYNGRTKQNMPLDVSILNDFITNSALLDIGSAAEMVKQKWLILHGERDLVVLPEIAYQLQNKNKNSMLKIIKNGDHVFGGRHPWAEKNLPFELQQACETTFNFITVN